MTWETINSETWPSESFPELDDGGKAFRPSIDGKAAALKCLRRIDCDRAVAWLNQNYPNVTVDDGKRLKSDWRNIARRIGMECFQW